MVIPALLVLAVGLLLGVVLSLAGFLLNWRRGNLKRAFLIWLLVCSSTGLLLVPVLCNVTFESTGEGPPTAESYMQVTRGMAQWALLPGASLCAGGLAQLICLFACPKKDEEEALPGSGRTG